MDQLDQIRGLGVKEMKKAVYTLGIDIGSTFIKAAVFSSKETRLLWKCSGAMVERKKTDREGFFEIEADGIYQKVRELLDEALALFPIEALLFSTQMHGFVYSVLGKEDVYVSWQDARCTEKRKGSSISYLEYLKTIVPGEWMQDCGVPLKPSLGMCNLYALLQEEAALPMEGTLYTLGSYLNVRLGGKNICHPSNAAPLGLMSQSRGMWHQELLTLLGFDKISLPWIAQEDFADCGRAQIGESSIRLYPDYGDQQVSVLGAMAKEKNVLINIATASQISCLSEKFIPGEYESRPYFGGRYLNTISNMPGGRNFAVLTDFLKDCAQVLCQRELSTGWIWDRIKENYHREENSLQVDVLFYPTENKTEGGSIRNIVPGSLSLSQLFSAAYQDAARHYKEALGRLIKEPAEGITFLGGVSWKNEDLIFQIAKVLKLPYEKSVLLDEALNGLYRLSLAAAGEIDGLSEAEEKYLREV